MTVKIHGNSYVTVAERMELMRKSAQTFEIVVSEPIQIGERCVWRCCIEVDGKRFYGSAECHFNAKPGTADATDPFACGETSAIGRALGFAGFGAVDAIASADEIVRTQPKGETLPAKKDLYEQGKAKNLWNKPDEFYMACSVIIRGSVNAANWQTLTPEQIKEVARHIEVAEPLSLAS